ncbi:T9SS type B sorting domain-containing protein [Chitinophaga japonensis]|uniref:Gliding motility-associated-like protein n=1 Tax=Chitinophaga japonensis TaxID=104662 RepID=A0A562TCZ8_CHIJA|nr:gliding motility-associated C-terminal domain-containing protein [Chitinophaga japonensis]TWI91253.1 gliding motility-associated-like protein [Chitinophaga japonensis]
MKYVLLPLLMLFVTAPLCAQITCTTKGQNPETAFPVCGTEKFTQSSVPICGGKDIPGLNCLNQHTDKNPFWYKFTCFRTGTLGFIITPHDLGEDYDWQLFDVTNYPINQVYTNKQLFVAANWSGEYGLTGASFQGQAHEVCDGFGQPLFSSMPTIQQGHNYLLLISHFSDSQSGYDLEFKGGTASITDPLVPAIQQVIYDCAAPALRVKLNKRVQCNSLAANGSDFTLTGGGAAGITGATGINCNSGFDMDSIVLTLSAPLPAGSYSLALKAGTDGNSLLDACETAGGGSGVPPTPFTVAQQFPSLPDHILPVGCQPDQVQLVLSQPVRCSSIAANGSDFTISGSTPVTVQNAAGGSCAGGLTDTITLRLSGVINTAGAYQVALRTGSDGNTLLSECWQPTPAGASLPFTTSDTVNADFSYTLTLDCTYDTVTLTHNGNNGVNSWQWSSDGAPFSTEQNPVKVYTVFGLHTIKLVVSNGVCSDSADTSIELINELDAAFSASADILCPTDVVSFANESTGYHITGYVWNFGNGIITSTPAPMPQSYPQLKEERDYTVSLIVQNDMNCFDTATRVIKVVPSCYIDVPTAFSPNGDGVNDYLYPLNGYKAVDLRFSVYNRLGQLVFETNDWQRKWDGTVGGRPQGVGTYVWMLTYTHRETGQHVFKKGVATLVR